MLPIRHQILLNPSSGQAEGSVLGVRAVARKPKERTRPHMQSSFENRKNQTNGDKTRERKSVMERWLEEGDGKREKDGLGGRVGVCKCRSSSCAYYLFCSLSYYLFLFLANAKRRTWKKCRPILRPPFWHTTLFLQRLLVLRLPLGGNNDEAAKPSRAGARAFPSKHEFFD